MKPTTLFVEADEMPATVLFPTVYRGPKQTIRKRPCTQDSTLRDVWERLVKPAMLQNGSAQSTINGYATDLKRWEEVTSSPSFGDGSFGEQGPTLRDINRDLLNEFRERLKNRPRRAAHRQNVESTREESPVSINTTNRIIRSLNVLLHRASPDVPGNPAGEGITDEYLNIRQFPRSRSAKRVASTEEVGAWYKWTHEAAWPSGQPVPAPLWWRTLIVLISHYGFRTRDNFDLKWEDIFWEAQCPNEDAPWKCVHGWIRMTPRKTARKKPDPLVLPMTTVVRAHLMSCWEASGKPQTGRVLKCPVKRKTARTLPDGQASNRTTQDHLQAERRRQQRRAGIERPYTFNQLRKTCNTWLRRIDRELGRLVLGHASRDVNDEYYYVGIGTIVEKLPLVPMPSAFSAIFRDRGDRQRRLFECDE